MSFNYKQQIDDFDDLCLLLHGMNETINLQAEEIERLNIENENIKDRLDVYEKL